jgi:hypothetical protein
MADSDSDDDGVWEKPAWAKGGVQLKSTGKAEAMKKDGNLAAPITFTPFKSQDHTNKVANPEKLNASDVGAAVKSGENLAAPITYTPYKNEDHTNYVADPNKLKETEQGKMAKEKGNLASPITNIRDEMKKKKKQEKKG